MGKRLRVEDKREQEQSGRPPAGTEVKIAVDLSRSKWVYCVRWEGAERLRLSTGGELKHLQALVRRYEGCRMHLAFEACGFGYQVAWWAREEEIGVTVIAPSRMERAPGLQVKTDRLDVGRMARQLEDGSLKGIYVPGRTGHERRQVVRTYGQAVKERTRAQVRIRSLLQEHGGIGPAPRAGWKPYREWLGTQQLPEDVQLCVETLLAMRAMAERHGKVLEQRLLALARRKQELRSAPDFGGGEILDRWRESRSGQAVEPHPLCGHDASQCCRRRLFFGNSVVTMMRSAESRAGACGRDSTGA